MGPDRAAFLVALPGGLAAGGVATWAVRLVNALAARGRPTGLILHAPQPGHAPSRAPLHPDVRVTDLGGLPPLDAAAGDLSPFVPGYERAAAELSPGARPVVISPNLLGDCYGLAAELSRRFEGVRVVGVLHNDIPYEYLVQRHYEPLLAAFIPVSRRLESGIADALPSRRGDIHRIAHGVDVPASAPAREPAPGRPLRLLYAGRMDHAQKRVLALIAMSRALADLPHELVLVGDGPAAPDVDAAIAHDPRISRLPAVGAERVLRLLEHADVAVLASRHEGLSVAVIEALSRACVPVITRTASGAGELIDDGVSGVLVDAPESGTDAAVGEAMARGVRRAAAMIEPLRAGAHRAALERFSLAAHADAWERVIDDAAALPRRAWPADRPAAFTARAGGGSGSVPPDAGARLRALLASLAGRRVLIHGTGRHTLELAEVFAGPPCEIVGFADDDASRHGTRLWNWAVVSPRDAASLGATDVVISSWLHEGVIWTRREVYESRGLRVHRLYAERDVRAHVRA